VEEGGKNMKCRNREVDKFKNKSDKRMGVRKGVVIRVGKG
jgi:hypothetical protein